LEQALDERDQYAVRRRKLLSSMVDLEHTTGLEIGACDLPTVAPNQGHCRFADFRTSAEMIELWKLQPDRVMPVSYLLSRDRTVIDQITDRFDYVVACHVLEHIPDVISYLRELKQLLHSGSGKVIFLTLPDKRATLDVTRPSTTVDRLVANYHNRLLRPQIEDVMEFHRHWIGNSRGAPLPISEAYEYAKVAVESPDVDAHCHVWEDSEFLHQVSELIAANFLPGLSVSLFEPNFIGTNEFALGLVTH
jgi:SAM-dependent methyltransferase